ncbi:capsule assembly Wzi family protein [Amylibacter sp.]|nr:capsule assembly Wzi family protein [Amylibacter sp.]
MKTFILSFILYFITSPLSAQFLNPSFKTWINIESKSVLGVAKSYSGINFDHYNHILSSNFALNFKTNEKINLDNSFLNYKSKNKTIGFGKINRHWSFSPQSSLFLSSNARPANSIYFRLDKKDKLQTPILSWMGPLTFEIFNSELENKLGPNHAKMLGTRFTFAPNQNLAFELIKITQWGGDNYSNSISNLALSIFGNTNENEFTNINQVAGIGFSHKINNKLFPLKYYGQLLGEDEAGGLPTCFIYLTGVELEKPIFDYSSIFGLELIDTRTHLSTENNCGPNAAYNNNTYKYTNYDTVLGAPIDSQGKSIHFWSSILLSKGLSLELGVKKILVNTNSYSKHRLSSLAENGYIKNINLSWSWDNLNIKTSLKHQSFSLDKVGIKKGLSASIYSSINF